MSIAYLMNRHNTNLLSGALSTSVIGDFRLFNNSLPPEYGYLKQGTGPYNVSDYLKLGKAFSSPTFTATPSTNAVSDTSAPIIGFGNGLFVIIYSGLTTYQTSADNGATWTTRTLPIAENWTTIHYANGVWLATGTVTNRFIRSTDGINWTQGTFPNSRDWYNFAYNGTVWIAVAYGTNQAATSPDGNTWTNRTLPTGTTWYTVAASPGVFVLPDYSSARVARSTDNGVTWSAFALPLSSAWNECVFANNQFVAISSSKLITGSADGLSWVERTIPLPIGGWKTVVYSGTTWLAFAPGASSEVAASSDSGVTWTKLTNTTNFTGSEQMAASGNGVIILVNAAPTRQILKAVLSLSNTFSVPSMTAPTGFEYWVKAIDATPISSLTISSLQTTSFNALANYEYTIDSTLGAITMTLPASPKNGDKIIALDFKLNFAINSLTINPNGNKINNIASSLTINTKGAGVSLVYIESLNSWAMEYNCTPSSLPALSGDNLTASALSTSLAAFNSASANSVVPITAGEFANLIAISSTTTIGAASSSMDLGVGGNGTIGGNVVNSIGGASLNGAKIVGFRALVSAATTVEIWQTLNTSVGGTATKLYTGNATATGLCFFVIKTPTAVVGDQFLAINNSTSAAIKSTGAATFTGAYALPPATGTVTFVTATPNINYPLIQLISRLT